MTLPCFTGVTEADSVSRYCAGVYYSDKAISFYTERKYIEVGELFKGKLNPASRVFRAAFFKLFGHPKLKDTDWEVFQMGYGTPILYYNKAGRINKIQISSKSTETIRLCE